MKHQLGLYERQPNEYPNLTVVMCAIGTVAMIVGGIGMTPPFSGMWTIYTFFIGLGLIVSNLSLYYTHVMRGIDTYDTRFKAWSAYKNLCPADKAKIRLNASDMRELNSDDAYELQYKFISLKEATDKAKIEKSKYSGPGFIYKQRVAELIKDRESEAEAARQVNHEMSELR